MAMQFDGTNNLESVSNFTPTNQGSVSFWASFDNVGATVQRPIGSANTFEIREVNGLIYNELLGSGGTSISTISANTLYHIVCTWNYSVTVAWQIYINGSLDNSGSNTYNDPGSDLLSIGARTGATSQRFIGILDDVRIYNRVLTAGEVQTIYASRGIDNIVNGRIHRWLLDEGMSNWTPEQLSSDVAWWDASDVNTITSSSGLVSQLRDKSGNGLHLNQATGSLQPLTGSATINSLNALVFDQDYMNTSSNPFGANVVNAHVFLLLRTPTTLVNGTAFTLTGSSIGANRWQSHCPWASGDVYFDAGGTSGGQRIQVTTLLTTSEVALMSFYNSNTSGVQEIRKNGTLAGSDATGLSVPTVGNIFLGSDGGATLQNMVFCEMIIINGVVTLETRQLIEGYAMWKYGLQASIPSGHPYLTASPQIVISKDQGTEKYNMNSFANPVYVGSELQYRRPVHPQ